MNVVTSNGFEWMHSKALVCNKSQNGAWVQLLSLAGQNGSHLCLNSI